MHYVLLSKIESTNPTTWKIKGLLPEDLEKLQQSNLRMYNDGNTVEIDVEGIQLLNMLASTDYNYRVCGQSMAIEKSKVGGRTIQIEKIAWTLGKDVPAEK